MLLLQKKINDQIKDYYTNKLVIRRLFYPDIAIPIEKFYEWVFRIPLRNLTEERYPSNQTYYPLDIIERECLAKSFGKDVAFLSAIDKIELETVLHHALKEKKVLIILDGFDEFPESSPDYLCKLIKNFLAVDPVIVTSRPYNLHALKNDYNFQENLRFEITGFTADEVKNYVNNFFIDLNLSRKQEAKRLIDFLARNPHIAASLSYHSVPLLGKTNLMNGQLLRNPQ